jgi:hypothetical protein
MAKRRHHVNPYQLLSFTDLTHEYARLLKVELDPRLHPAVR